MNDRDAVLVTVYLIGLSQTQLGYPVASKAISDTKVYRILKNYFSGWESRRVGGNLIVFARSYYLNLFK